MELAPEFYCHMVEIIVLLLDHGADINARDTFQVTAIIYTAAGLWDDVVALLLSRGADIYVTCDSYSSPLCAVIIDPITNTISSFVNQPDDAGVTPLACAIGKDSLYLSRDASARRSSPFQNPQSVPVGYGGPNYTIFDKPSPSDAPKYR